MLNKLWKKVGSSSYTLELFEFSDLSVVKDRLVKLPSVAGASVSSPDTIQVTLKYDKKLQCMLKVFGGGKAVFVTQWDLNKKNRLAYLVGTRIWNDQKDKSHLTLAYTTQQDVCVFESHVNLEWGIPERHFQSWITHYLGNIAEFDHQIDQVKESLKKLPKSKLSVLEKLEVAGEIAGIVGSVANLLDL